MFGWFKKKPKLVDYLCILHEYGVNSEQAQEYKEKFSKYEKFKERADKLDYMFKLYNTFR